MVYRKNTLIKFAALLLSASALTPVANTLLERRAALAQSFGDNPESFPIPSSLPDGTTLAVDGSTSMQVINQALESRFEAQYPNIDVELDASRTDAAIAALLAGDIDLVASGRPLTADEKAQGLVEVPLEREKIAFIVGPDNAFDGNLTFEQFAQIFRGEITNWSEIGGPDLPIRVVDRPEYSDTRRALSTYEVFQGQPFATGATAAPVPTDETAAVIEALGNDGIGYAVYSQVEGLDTVRILPMHQTLPDDPKYPYSQYRAFVYKEGAAPAVLAFLGLATTPPGEEVILDSATAVDGTAAVDDEAIATEAESAVADEESAAAEAPSEITATDEEATALVPDAAPAGEARRFPWWLLGIPIVGGLLWWLFKGLRGGAPPAAAPLATPIAAAADEPRLILTPRNCRDAYAYWEIPRDRLEAAEREGVAPLKVRLYDVTGRAKDAVLPPHTAEFDCAGNEPDLHLPIAVDNHDYLAEVGYLDGANRWVPLAKSEPVRVPACADNAPVKSRVPGTALGATAVGAAGLGAAGLGAAALAKRGLQSRMVLTPRNSRDAYAYWEVPDDRWTALRAEGGQRRMVRLYDVTNRLPNAPLPAPVDQFDCVADEPDLHLPIQQSDRDYVAEVGYLTADNRWLPAAKSAPVRVPAEMTGGQPGAHFPGAAIAGGAATVGAAAVGAAAVGAAERLQNAITPDRQTSRIVLTPRTPKKAYAYWEISEPAKARVKAEGGQDFQLRIYDATNIDINRQPPHSVLTYDVGEGDRDRFVPLPARDRDYIAEIGYRAADGTWLDLARSLPVRADAVLGSASGVAAGLGVAAGGLAAAAKRPGREAAIARTGQCAIQTVQVHSRDHAVELDDGQMERLQTSVAAKCPLDTGLYVLRIRAGAFNYDGDASHPGEPFVVLWIYGGQVVNQKTGVPVNATWSTLNGYADTLTLDVREPAQVSAFFMDTFPDDNAGEVTLSVIKL